MPCLITALPRAAIKKTTRTKNKQQKNENKNFTTKTQYLNLNAASDNVRMQSDKILTAIFFLFTQQMAILIIETR